MATDGSQLFVGGDFTTVNNKPQQGIAIFPPGSDSAAPANPTTAPTVTSTSAGVDSVSFPATCEQGRRHADLQDLPRRRLDADRYPDRHVLAGAR